jgi:predicted HD phosphohydrolase
MQAKFSKMSDSTAEDWAIIAAEAKQLSAGLPDRILRHLELLNGDFGGFPIDRLQHCLQTAELAANAGEDEEYVVCALLHDIGDTLGSTNHADVSAAILEPFVSEENHWMVKHHAIFQGYNFFHHLGMDRNMRDQFIDHPCYQRTAHFIARYDDPAFEASKPKLELGLFEDMVKRVFAKPKQSLYKAVME